MKEVEKLALIREALEFSKPSVQVREAWTRHEAAKQAVGDLLKYFEKRVDTRN